MDFLNKNWEKLLSREGVDFLTVSVIDTVFYDAIWTMDPSKKELFFTKMHQQNFTHYIGIKETELGKYLFNKHFNTPQKITKLICNGDKLIKNTNTITNFWKKQLKKDDSNILLLKILSDFRKEFTTINYFYSILPWWAIEFWQNEFDKIISRLITNKGLENRQEIIISSAYRPLKETAVIQLQREIQQKKDKKILLKKYQFLRSWSAIWYRPIDEAWIESLNIKTDQRKLKLYSIKKLINLLKPIPAEKKYLELAPYLIFFKDYRDDIRRKQVYLWSFLFEAIAKKYKVDHRDIGYLSISELEEALRLDKIDNKIIEYRKNNLCIITADMPNLKMKVIDRNIPKKYIAVMDSVDNQNKDVLIKGLIAQKGKVVGKVRIVKSFHDIRKILSGEILVANTTHPDYLPAMQKAAGFITNEGGVISHAAIVARELKKPCIVGTKIATKILRDGDMVEVDANNGIVKIIKKK
ncbi:MAG: PEP-utilizing enzyme [Patescibacteria group bacterium]